MTRSPTATGLIISDYPQTDLARKALAETALIYYQTDKLDEAITAYKDVIARYPGSDEARTALVDLKSIYVEKGDVNSYVAYSETVQGAAPIAVSERDSLSYTAAEGLFSRGEIKQAKAKFSDYLEQFPNGAFASNAWYYQGVLLEEENDYDGAYESFMHCASYESSRFAEGALDHAATMAWKVGDLNVASQIGLVDKVDGKTNAAILKDKMESYREFMATIDTAKAQSIRSTFSTDPLSSTEKGGKPRAWESGVFEDMPAIATLTVLNKIKNDVKITESEALAYLIGSMDAGDFRVNKIQALAIPNSSYIMRGGKYSAQIILAATDSTKKPVITINGTPLEKDRYEFVCTSVGTKKYSGNMVLTKKNGETQTYNFESEYTVGEPTATVSADLMNVLYAGFKNPISVSVPGVAANSIEISPSNIKSSSRTATGWLVVPAKVGTPCNISVSAKVDGKTQHIATKTFRVKKLPDPLAMIEYTNAQGIKSRYRGNSFDKAIAKPLFQV